MRNKKRAEQVRAETEEPVITAAQKFFFLQRQKKASEGRALSAQMSEQVRPCMHAICARACIPSAHVHAGHLRL